MSVYFGRWSDYEAMRESWFEGGYDYEAHAYKQTEIPSDFPPEDSVLFASYGGGSYEGDALVIFKRDGELYEASGSHCSCYGLEGRWEPEKTTVEALAIRNKKTSENEYWYFLHDHDEGAVDAYWKLVESLKST